MLPNKIIQTINKRHFTGICNCEESCRFGIWELLVLIDIPKYTQKYTTWKKRGIVCSVVALGGLLTLSGPNGVDSQSGGGLKQVSGVSN